MEYNKFIVFHDLVNVNSSQVAKQLIIGLVKRIFVITIISFWHLNFMSSIKKDWFILSIKCQKIFFITARFIFEKSLSCLSINMTLSFSIAWKP